MRQHVSNEMALDVCSDTRLRLRSHVNPLEPFKQRPCIMGLVFQNILIAE